MTRTTLPSPARRALPAPTRRTLPSPARRTLLLSAGLLPLLAACGTSSGAGSASSAASDAGGATAAPADGAPITVTDAWAKAAESGMTAAFGTITSALDAPITLVGATSPVSSELQLHETTSDGSGGMSMRQKDGGFEIPAGGTLVLEPGGNHIMIMSLSQPLLAGDELEVTLVFDDGTEVPFTAQIRDYAGAQEEYTSGMDGMGDMDGMDHDDASDGGR